MNRSSLRRVIVLGLLVLLTAQAVEPHLHIEASRHPEICAGHLDGAEGGAPLAHVPACSACAGSQRLRLLAVGASSEIVAIAGTLGGTIALPEPCVAQPARSASDAPRAPPLVPLSLT